MLKEDKNGIIISLKILPNSSKNAITFADGILKVKITAQPVEGKANKALIEFLAKEFKIPKTCIEIVKGKTNKEKNTATKKESTKKQKESKKTSTKSANKNSNKTPREKKSTNNEKTVLDSKKNKDSKITEPIKKPYFYSVFKLLESDKTFNLLDEEELNDTYRYQALRKVLTRVYKDNL